MEVQENNLHTASIQIPFLSSNHAEIAYNTLSVDVEPRRSGATKLLSFTDNILNIELSAKEARQLRVSCNSIFDHVILVMQTIDEFGLSE